MFGDYIQTQPTETASANCNVVTTATNATTNETTTNSKPLVHQVRVKHQL